MLLIKSLFGTQSLYAIFNNCIGGEQNCLKIFFSYPKKKVNTIQREKQKHSFSSRGLWITVEFFYWKPNENQLECISLSLSLQITSDYKNSSL